MENESPTAGRGSQGFFIGCDFKLAWFVVKTQNGSPQGAAAEGGLLAHVCRWNAAPSATDHASLKTHPYANLAENCVVLVVGAGRGIK
jgi:hypothetical protein